MESILTTLITGKYADFEAGAIVLGWVAALLILACLVATAVGLVIVMRAHLPRHAMKRRAIQGSAPATLGSTEAVGVGLYASDRLLYRAAP